MRQSVEESSNYPDTVTVAGTFFGSFVFAIFLIFACVACRRRKKGNNSRQNEQAQNEYEIPEVNVQRQTSTDGANVYTVPKPNIVYTDLDKLALSNPRKLRTQPSEEPIQYAIIDEEKLEAARKQRQERHYANIDNGATQSAEEKLEAARKQRQERHYANIDNGATQPAIYENVHVEVTV